MISISFVLFFIGVFASIVIFGNAFANYAQESIVMKVFLHDGLSEGGSEDFISKLEQKPYVSNFRYVSKEEAGEILISRTNENFMEIMDGVNPLLNSINVSLKPDFIRVDSLDRIKQELESHLVVAEVEYPGEMVAVVKKNIGAVTIIVIFLSFVLMALAFYLIFGTIRLAIFAKRLNIRTMQLIGATQAFIRKPFLLNGSIQGGISGILAAILLISTFYIIQSRLTSSGLMEGITIGGELIGLLSGIILFGALLGFVGSFLAVNRYLNKKLDELM
ncbi:MAG: permease-like cell division protein FtsX [Bacteroidota bacterium]